MGEWPAGVEWDALRKLQDAGLDFSLPYKIDFSVDFNEWPPRPAAIDLLGALFSSIKIVEATGDAGACVQFQVIERLSYEVIVGIQSEVSREMAAYGGICKFREVVTG